MGRVSSWLAQRGTRLLAKTAEVGSALDDSHGQPTGGVAPALLELPNSSASAGTDVESGCCDAAAEFSGNFRACVESCDGDAEASAGDIHVHGESCGPGPSNAL